MGVLFEWNGRKIAENQSSIRPNKNHRKSEIKLIFVGFMIKVRGQISAQMKFTSYLSWRYAHVPVELSYLQSKPKSQNLLPVSNASSMGLESAVLTTDISTLCWGRMYTLPSSDCCVLRVFVLVVADWMPLRESANIWKYAWGPQPAHVT